MTDTDIVEQLRRHCDFLPPRQWTFNAMREAADEIERLRDLIEVLIYNDPNARMPDNGTVLDVWRKEARRALNIQQATGERAD